MNQYFKAAAKRFGELTKSKSFNINPISEIDSEIIGELKEVLKKLGATNICAILDSYKYLKDEEIRDSLLQWNIDNPMKPKGEVAEGSRESLISELIESIPNGKILVVNGERIDLRYIFGYEPKKLERETSTCYAIRFNPTPEHAVKIPFYSNKLVKFGNRVDQEFAMAKLDEIFSERNDLINLNRDND